MAAGVGKTYRMLQEGRAEQEAGRDVVDRLPRDARAGGDRGAGRRAWSVLPRRGRSSTAAIWLEEMDLPAILLARARALPDRRARPHQRAGRSSTPSATRTSRTCSTPASTCSPPSTSSTSRASTTRSPSSPACACARRSPTRCSPRADEVVLIDLTPEALIAAAARRARSTRSERVEAALDSFFKVENLRRCARSRCARSPRTSEAKRLVRRGGASAPARSAARRCAAARWRSGCSRWSRRGQSAQRLVRRAWRSAQRLGSELDLLWVRPPGRPPGDDEERSCGRSAGSPRCLARTCSSRRATTSPRSPPVAGERGTTYLLLGRPEPLGGSAGCARRWSSADAQAPWRGHPDGRRAARCSSGDDPLEREAASVEGGAP